MADDNYHPSIKVSALDAGHLTLPEHLFITDADPEKRATVPSLSFLIQHPGSSKQPPTKLLFDLGIKRDLTGYTIAQQEHIAKRQPVIVDPDCAASLRNGHDHGTAPSAAPLLDPAKDIDYIILSHVHWDHIGTWQDFPSAIFLVGAGTINLLKDGAPPHYPSPLFTGDELPPSRTAELPPVPRIISDENHPHYIPPMGKSLPKAADTWSWKPLFEGKIPHSLDLFGDGSILVIDSPGHLYGHINLLMRVGSRRYLYLGGDCCHDPRILTGEKGIALYDDGCGGKRSVHVDTEVAGQTLENIRQMIRGVEGSGVEVEVVVAHDAVWREKNRHRFWPGTL